MDATHNLKLIDGEFTPAEARKMILDLVSSKINYHAMEAFSIRERFNGDVAYSEKRIEELKKARSCLEDFINQASDNGLNLKVESVINIAFSK